MSVLCACYVRAMCMPCSIESTFRFKEDPALQAPTRPPFLPMRLMIYGYAVTRYRDHCELYTRITGHGTTRADMTGPQASLIEAGATRT